MILSDYTCNTPQSFYSGMLFIDTYTARKDTDGVYL